MKGEAVEDMLADLAANAAHNVRRMRRERGWRQVDLERHSGVHLHTIQRIESGADFYLGTLFRLAISLGAGPAEFFRWPREAGAIPVFDQAREW